MGNDAGIPFGFDTYGTSKGGCVVGKVYEDSETGKRFRFCQAHTTFVSTTLNPTAATQRDPVVQVGTTFGVASDDVSAGLSATHPMCLGLPTSQCPVSTATVTRYFWAQVLGVVHTTVGGSTLASVKMNTDDDAAAGDTIIMTNADAACNTIAAGTASGQPKDVGIAIVGVTGATDLVTGVYAKCGMGF